MLQHWSRISRNRSGMVPESSRTLLGHFWVKTFFKQNKNHETPTGRKTDFVQNTSGHENPNMASKINVLQQKSSPRAKLFGAGVIVPWAFLIRRILLSDQRIRIFSSAVGCDGDMMVIENHLIDWY